ncbi:MAG: FtsX-like permease family protein [Bacteroidales bacterium]
MNFERYIASRISGIKPDSVSGPVVRLGIAGVALGIAVMLIALAIVTGFQQQIRQKMYGFTGHILVSSYETSRSQEPLPGRFPDSLIQKISATPGIDWVAPFATKAGIVKTSDQIEGVVLKGVDFRYNPDWINSHLIEGALPDFNDSRVSNEVIVSRSLARRLKLKTGDFLRIWFLNKDATTPRGRRFVISGIYETGMDEFDRLYVLGDIHHIRKLNGWDAGMAEGLEIHLIEPESAGEMNEAINMMLPFELQAATVSSLYPQIFEWLKLQDINVVVIIILMVLVSVIAMISTLLILILEKTGLIGILKAMGSRNRSIRSIFLYQALYIVGRGLLAGNLIAFTLSVIQLKFGIFKLDQSSYYIPEVPVHLSLTHYILINVGVLLVCVVVLVIPTQIISRISPVKAIRFE